MRFRPLRATTGAILTIEEPPELPDVMRAAAIVECAPHATLRTVELPVPTRVLSEVLVRVVAAGVNPIDSKTRRGAGVAHAVTEFPAALGFDFSGIVVRSPSDTHPFPVGTPVYGMAAFPRTSGTYAEYVVASTLSIAAKPASLSHAEAAGVPLAALTAWGLVVETARAHEGQRILIHAGAGGVGHFAIQLAAYFGAHVTATGSERNAGWMRELGASLVIDHTTTRFEDVVSDVDVVIDLVGNVHDDTGTRSLGVLRPGGLYVVVPTGSWPGYADAARDAGVRATSYVVTPDGQALATIGRLLEAGTLQVFVDRVFTLDEAQAAHDAIDEGHTRGKLVLQVSEL